LDFFSALDAAAAIKLKKVSSVELTRRTFERIDKYNPKLNAFAYQLRDRALAEAHKADDAVARKKQLGSFHGVPFCVKRVFRGGGRARHVGNSSPEEFQSACELGCRGPFAQRRWGSDGRN
jgi:Asp-tRNA(Asn)/Glu-tRNA(Gln) amidotransferase A subunit family amidase